MAVTLILTEFYMVQLKAAIPGKVVIKGDKRPRDIDVKKRNTSRSGWVNQGRGNNRNG